MCNCKEQPALIDISNNHSDFKSKLGQLDVGKMFWGLYTSLLVVNELVMFFYFLIL